MRDTAYTLRSVHFFMQTPLLGVNGNSVMRLHGSSIAPEMGTKDCRFNFKEEKKR